MIVWFVGRLSIVFNSDIVLLSLMTCHALRRALFFVISSSNYCMLSYLDKLTRYPDM